MMRGRERAAAALENEREILNAAVELLARREYSGQELRRKLGGRVDDPQLLETVLERLAEQGLQSDLRCATMLARQRVAQGYGEYRVKYDLQQKGIASDLIQQALEALEVDWFALARGYACKRFGATPAVDFKERSRRARHLQGRGFSYDELNYALDCAQERDALDADE